MRFCPPSCFSCSPSNTWDSSATRYLHNLLQGAIINQYHTNPYPNPDPLTLLTLFVVVLMLFVMVLTLFVLVLMLFVMVLTVCGGVDAVCDGGD
jgi:hypothetical protein